jgi:16S rRNA (guanine527-N7)-methyltransferase
MMTKQQVLLEKNVTLARYLDAPTLEKLCDTIFQENKKVNLVSRETRRPDLERLIAESLLPLDVLPERIGNYIDIGSGGGIPALPILLSKRITGATLLFERTLKKAAALKRILQVMDLKAGIFAKNFEEFPAPTEMDLVTLRFVKLTPKLLEQIIPTLSETGRFVYYSTPEFNISNYSAEVFTFTEPGLETVKSFTVFSSK